MVVSKKVKNILNGTYSNVGYKIQEFATKPGSYLDRIDEYFELQREIQKHISDIVYLKAKLEETSLVIEEKFKNDVKENKVLNEKPSNTVSIWDKKPSKDETDF